MVKQLEQLPKSNEIGTKANYGMAMLIVNYGKVFARGEFIKDCHENGRENLP